MKTNISTLVGLVLLACGVCFAQGVTFSDGVFKDVDTEQENNAADWTTFVIPRGPDGISSGSAKQILTGGSPNEYLEVKAGRDPITAGLDNSTRVWMIFKTAYGPSSVGAIATMDMTIDHIQVGGGSGGGLSPALLQGGRLYVANGILMPETAWTHASFVDLTAASFFELDNRSSHPDFSSSGAEIQFGWAYAVSTPSENPVSRTVGFDNWFVEVHPEGATFEEPFNLTNLQGKSVATNGLGDLKVGYGRIVPDAGSTTPSGVAIFGFRQNGVVVSEAGVPSSPLITAGRIYAEVSGIQGTAGAVNTGIAIANPNNQDATLTFYFTDEAGSDSQTASFTLGANQQRANFLDEAPFNSGASFRGAFSFSSTVPVAVIALRGYYTERAEGSEFLITTLPVVNTGAPASISPVVIPHFADGGGWRTQVVLINPTDAVLTGTAQFLSPGSPTTPGMPLGAPIAYSIARRGTFKIATDGTATATVVGSVRITPSQSQASPAATSIFAYKVNGVTGSEAGVVGVLGNALRMYVETSGIGNAPGTIHTGIAFANPESSPATVTFELFKLDGTPAGIPNASVTLGANGQGSKFLFELFPSLPVPFKGIMRISTTAPSGVSLVGLRARYNERPEGFLITTTPAADESAPATNAERVFPHLVNGGGYTTQFILFAGSAGQNSVGSVRFFEQNGLLLSLTLN
jgi:hypothetical protein